MDVDDGFENFDEVAVAVRPPIPSQAARLSWDVLITVAENAIGLPLLQLMRTCRILYHAGAPYLLADRDIEVGDSLLRVLSFCTFVLRDPERRARPLRSLRLSSRFVVTSTARDQRYLKMAYKMLARVFRYAKNIAFLSIQDSEEILAGDPTGTGLSKALSSLRKVTRVELTDARELTQDAFAEMQAPIEEADVLFDCSFKHGFEHPDPAFTFRHAHGSLTSLFIQSYGGEYDFPVPETPFSTLRSLHMESTDPQTSLVSLMQAFPNITSFHWHDHRDEEISDDVDRWPDNSEELRAQELLLTADQWARLDVLGAEIMPCYIAGLQSPVRRWSFRSLRVNNVRQFHTVMNDIRPSTLIVEFNANLFDHQEDLELFPVFPLKHLRATINLDEGKKPTGRFLECMSHALRTLALTSIALNLCHLIKRKTVFTSLPLNPDGQQSSDEEDSDAGYNFRMEVVDDMSTPDPIRDYLSSMDVTAYAEFLARIVPTLEVISIIHGGDRQTVRYDDPKWYFHIARSEDGAISIEKLDPEAGEGLFERLAA
ncbi:hypothetical protein EIP91_002974 [Steccherinum ochraceum]|uniref:F-box domain-containing protein n=1 Tax=Steccherinum ochraceum TaxID=92696 RepID=A0A4V2MW78_9APHY|nr:hypothetical protein EIP91_002974 [Steccherinum ochraceum]